MLNKRCLFAHAKRMSQSKHPYPLHIGRRTAKDDHAKDQKKVREDGGAARDASTPRGPSLRERSHSAQHDREGYGRYTSSCPAAARACCAAPATSSSTSTSSVT